MSFVSEIKAPETLTLCVLTEDPVYMPVHGFGAFESLADEVLLGVWKENPKFLDYASQKNARITRFNGDLGPEAMLNILIEQASSSWIFVLFSNEYLMPEDASRVAFMLKHPIGPAYEFPFRCYMEGNVVGATETDSEYLDLGFSSFYRETRLLRLFKKNAELFYNGSLDRLNFRDGSSVRCRPFCCFVPLHCFGRVKKELPTYNKAEILVRVHEIQTLQHPNDSRAFEALGTQFLELKRCDLAIAPLERAFALNKNGFLILNSLGYAYMEVGRHDEALKVWNAALRINPSLSVTYMNVGVLHMRHGRWEAAIEQLRKALKLQPDEPQSHYNLGQCYVRMNNLNQGLKHFRQAVRYDPKCVAAMVDMGGVLVMIDRMTEANAYLNRALLLEPDHELAMHHMGLSLLKNGDMDNGVSIFRRWLSLYPQNQQVVDELSAQFPELGDLREGS